MKRGWLFGIFLLVGLFLVGFIFAAHTITTSSGGISFSVDEDTANLFNITVNNTDAGAEANITSVNITLPSGASCTFVDASNGTSIGSNNTPVADGFTNSSNSLIWTNTTGYVINGTEYKYFWFNATCTEPGDYNITIYTTNVTGIYPSNLSLEVNDTGSPTASMGTNPVNTRNSSSVNVTFDIKCVDGYSISTAVLYGNWSSSGWHSNQTNASVVNNSYWNITVTNIADGIYKWGVYCNDTAGNSDWSTANRTLRVDTTNPSPSPSCTPSTIYTGDTVTCSCGGSDTGGSGIRNSSASSTPSTTSSGTFTYSCTVTDYAGNSATSTTSYTVQGQTSNTGSSSSGGGTTSTFSYSKSIPKTANEFSELKKIETSELSDGGLRARERIMIKINEQEHHVGVRELTETTATIEIASDPVQVELDVGEDAKVDVDEDNIYDIYIILNGISGGKADLTISYLHEEKSTETNGSVSTTGEDVTPSVEDSVGEEKNYNWVYWMVGIILIVLILWFIFRKKNN